MELSRPRPYGAEGRKPTHDFLSLYSHSTAPQDPRPTSQGNYNLKTHDFLQPLERVGKACAKEEIASAEMSTAEKPPPPAPSPVEHVLPGGIGTYSISHIPYFIPIRAPKPEGTVFAAAQTSSSDRNDENSHCSSYTGSGFTLWEESAAKKGKTGKENARDKSSVLEGAAAGRGGQWGTSSEQPTQSSSNNHHGSFTSLSSSQPSGQRSQSFMEMIKLAKGGSAVLEDDELEEEDHYVLKKEISTATITHKELRVKVAGKSSDQKANTPRSKHSATEQRRRSKINDRFQMLRELIPHGDQKRDKASFLLEVIEYIQFLQDKVQKYDGPYQRWNNEQTKLMPWRNNNRIGESFDHYQGMNMESGPASSFAAKFEEKPLLASPTIPGTAQNPVESDTSAATITNPTIPGTAQNPVESDTSAATITNKGMSFPMSLHPNFFSCVRSGGAVPQAPSGLLFDVENTSSQPHSQLRQTRSCTTVDGAVAGDKIKEEELTIEGGTISISSAYSQGLLSTLTRALQSSGVDLSQASISVQIELGKRPNLTAASTSVTTDNKMSSSNQGMKHSRAPNSDDPNQAQKKLKASKN